MTESLFHGARRLLLVDAPSGIAGDMFLMAMVDLGFDVEELVRAFAAGGDLAVECEVEEALSGGLRGKRLRHRFPGEHEHRGLADCLAVVDGLGLPPEVASLARRLFERLAAVEGGLHGKTPESVHFHELGAADSIFDIVGAALALHRLNVGTVYLRHLGVGKGSAGMAHGELPVPAPAAAELLRGFTLAETGVESELVTPTGALILAECARPLPAGLRWRSVATGYGAGHKDFPGRPNLLRLTLAEPAGEKTEGLLRRELPVLRCTVDDMNPERYGWLMERLFAAGALDVSYRAVQMKKNRPGLEIEVLAAEGGADALANVLFAETTTLGLRVATETRIELPRIHETVATPAGPVRMKVATLPDGRRRAAPEYEDCADLARKLGLTFGEVEDAARAAWLEQERGGRGR